MQSKTTEAANRNAPGPGGTGTTGIVVIVCNFKLPTKHFGNFVPAFSGSSGFNINANLYALGQADSDPVMTMRHADRHRRQLVANVDSWRTAMIIINAVSRLAETAGALDEMMT